MPSSHCQRKAWCCSRAAPWDQQLQAYQHHTHEIANVDLWNLLGILGYCVLVGLTSDEAVIIPVESFARIVNVYEVVATQRCHLGRMGGIQLVRRLSTETVPMCEGVSFDLVCDKG